MSVFAVVWNPVTEQWELDAEATAVAQLAGWDTLDDVPAGSIPLDTAYGDDASDDD